jgi:hypothetical protein
MSDPDALGCGLRTTGTAACWGFDAGAVNATPSAASFTALSNGGEYVCGIRTDAALQCWGGPFTNVPTPPPGGGFVWLDSGTFTACAIRTDTTITCWGSPINTGAAPPPPPPAGGAASAPVSGAPAGGATATPSATAPARGLPRLPVAFGNNGVFALPSNRSCVSRRHFRIRIRRQRAGVTLISAAVSVNGRRVAVRMGRRLTAPVDLRGLPEGRFTVRVSALTADGRAIAGSRRYRTCAAKRAAGGHGPLVFAVAASLARVVHGR